MVTQSQNEFELHARAILGLPVETELRQPGASAVIYGGTDAAGVVFSGIDRALNVPGVEVRLFGKPQAYEFRRMGVALAVADSVEEARQKAGAASATVSVSVA